MFLCSVLKKLLKLYLLVILVVFNLYRGIDLKLEYVDFI